MALWPNECGRGSPSPGWMDVCLYIGMASLLSKLCGGMGARHGGCHPCPLGHFINSARGQVTLYMMAEMTRE